MNHGYPGKAMFVKCDITEDADIQVGLKNAGGGVINSSMCWERL